MFTGWLISKSGAQGDQSERYNSGQLHLVKLHLVKLHSGQLHLVKNDKWDYFSRERCVD